MEELKIIVNDGTELPKIGFNFEKLRDALDQHLHYYTNLEVTEDNMKNAKDDRATLNSLEKQVAQKQKEVKETVLGEFEEKTKVLRGMIKNASDSIDKQVKTFEEIEKNEKLNKIKLYYEEHIGNLKDVLSFESIFNSKWLNKTVTLKSIETEIKSIIEKVKNDLSVIDTIDSEFKLQIKDYYLRELNLSAALAEKARLEEQKKVINSIDNVADTLISEEKKEEFVPDWANDSDQPKEFKLTIQANSQQKQTLIKFLESQKIKYEEVK